MLPLPPPGELSKAVLGGGELHCYRVPLENRERLVVSFLQRGTADLRLKLPDGQSLDSPFHYIGDELWFGIAHTSTDILRVELVAPAGVREDYAVLVEHLRSDEMTAARSHAAALFESTTEEVGHDLMARQLANVAQVWEALERWSWAAVAHAGAAYNWRQSGDSYAASDALERAGELFKLNGDPASLVEVLNFHALTALNSGSFDEATHLLERAEEIGLVHDSGIGLATTWSNQGLLHHYQGDLGRARELYLQADALNRKLNRPHARLLQLNNLGGIHFVKGEVFAAEERFLEVFRIGEELERREAQAAALGNLGLVRHTSGAYTEALSSYEKLLNLYRALDDQFGEARALDRIGQVYMGLGFVERAVDYLDRSRQLRLALEERRELSHTLRRLAKAYLLLGDLVTAKETALQGLELANTPADSGKLHLVLGQIRMTQEHFEEAEGEFLQAAEKLEAASNPVWVAVARIRGAEATLKKGGEFDPDELERLLPVFHDAAYFSEQVHLHYVLALHDFMHSRFQSALTRLDAANTVIESVRSAIPMPELRAGYASTRTRVGDLRVAALMALHDREPDAGHAKRALVESDRAKARALREMLDRQGITPSGNETEAARERHRLLRQINFHISQQAGKRTIEHDGEVAEWRARLDVLNSGLAVQEKVITEYPGNDEGELLRRLRELLGDDGVLVQYHLGRHGSFAWIVSRDFLDVSSLPPADEIDARVREVRRVMERRSISRSERKIALQSLAEAVVDPVQPLAGSYSQWYVVADDALHVAPFSALPLANGNSLSTAHVVRMLPSARIGLRLSARQLPPGPLDIVLMGDPVYDATDSRMLEMPKNDSKTARIPRAGRLPASARELDAVMQALPDAEFRTFTGFDVSPDILHEPVLADADVLHFAVHGVFDSRAPGLSGLLLSRFDDQRRENNGFVGLADIHSLELGASLVVLSGCETALGDRLDGEGVIGLTSGFLAAGSLQTLATLWRVSDSATATFMQHFYQALEGLDAAAALRAAQQAMRADRRWRHPYFWSGFVVHGLPPAEVGSNDLLRQ